MPLTRKALRNIQYEGKLWQRRRAAELVPALIYIYGGAVDIPGITAIIDKCLGSMPSAAAALATTALVVFGVKVVIIDDDTTICEAIKDCKETARGLEKDLKQSGTPEAPAA
ncbi:MAG: hypothetical protein LBM73_02920 [Candidatus Nomurabacteria bacterium]|jgi:hypothetical protein|nr:hypothetical protein [Candidatus Nomurabacteria bacterium]